MGFLVSYVRATPRGAVKEYPNQLFVFATVCVAATMGVVQNYSHTTLHFAESQWR